MITNSLSQVKALHYGKTPTETAKQKNAAQAVAEKQKTDILELGSSVKENTGNYTVDRQKINQLKLEHERNSASFKEMVREMIEKQRAAALGILPENDALSEILVSSETQSAAAEAISENGYWGVKETSNRILEFAKTLSGGDPSKIEALKDAFQRGFDQAKKAFGGKLPEISQKTYDRVMEGFDEWANEGAAKPE